MAEEPKFRRGPSGEIHDVGPRLRWIEGRGPYSPDKTELAQERAARVRVVAELADLREELRAEQSRKELNRELLAAAEQRAERAEAERDEARTLLADQVKGVADLEARQEAEENRADQAEDRFEQLAAAVREWEHVMPLAVLTALKKLTQEEK